MYGKEYIDWKESKVPSLRIRICDRLDEKIENSGSHSYDYLRGFTNGLRIAKLVVLETP